MQASTSHFCRDVLVCHRASRSFDVELLEAWRNAGGRAIEVAPFGRKEVIRVRKGCCRLIGSGMHRNAEVAVAILTPPRFNDNCSNRRQCMIQ